VIADNEKRLQELNRFYKIGRAQLTDVLTFQSAIASLYNNLEMTRGQLAVAQEVLVYLTQWNRDALLQPEATLQSAPLADLNDYLTKVEQRPDVQSALANALAFEENVPIAFGAHLPSLNLNANYYLTRPQGILHNVNWDAQLALTVPLFQGGVVNSQVRQAHSIARQHSYLLSQTRRKADQEVRTFYAQLRADQKQVEKLEELVGISEKNVETEINYFRNGLVRNIDVLSAMTTYEDANRQLDHQRYVLLSDRAKLEAATGGRPEIRVEIEGEILESSVDPSVSTKG
jgi:outer membrane protein